MGYEIHSGTGPLGRLAEAGAALPVFLAVGEIAQSGLPPLTRSAQVERFVALGGGDTAMIEVQFLDPDLAPLRYRPEEIVVAHWLTWDGHPCLAPPDLHPDR